MAARKGTRLAQKLKGVLLRLVLLLLLALFGLEYVGFPRYGASQFFDWGRRIVQSDSLSEAADVLKNGIRKHDVPVFPGVPADLTALAQSAPFVTLDNLPESEGRTFIVLYRNEPQFPRNSRQRTIPSILFHRWMNWGAAGPLTASWDRNSCPPGPGGLSVWSSQPAGVTASMRR